MTVLCSGSLLAQMTAISGATGRIPVAPSANSSSPLTINVTGRVINAVTGQPVPRALVRLNGDRAVLADHEGKFEILQFAATNASSTVEVIKPGFYSSTEPYAGSQRRIRLEDLSNGLEIKMYPEALITGTVTGPDGQPLPHVNVMAQRSAYDTAAQQTWMTAGQSVTNEGGAFRIAVPPGDYRLESMYGRTGQGQVELPSLIPENNATNKLDFFHLRSGTEQHFELRPVVARTYSVSINVDSAGEGRFPMIIARLADGTAIPLGGMRPSGPGEMKLELPSGTYTLQATLHLPGSSPGPDRFDAVFYGETAVTVTDHDLAGVSLHLAAVPPISLLVDVDSAATSDKTPPAAQQLGLLLEAVDSTQAFSGQNIIGVSSSADGKFQFRPAPGSYRLVARSGGAWYVKSASYGTSDLLTQDLTVVAGAEGGSIRLTISDQTGVVLGAVSLHGDPADCEIYFVPTTASAKPVYSIHSRSDGTYNLANLPPGTYRVIAFEQQHSMNFRDPHALDAFATHVRTVTVAPGSKDVLSLEAVAESEVAP